MFNSDNGTTWGREYVLRHGAGEPVIGYIRTMQRLDGKLLTVYYRLDESRSERYITAMILSVPKVD
jgi:hypothetical protein